MIAMIAGGAAFPRIILGVPSSGVVTRWGLPISKLFLDVAGLTTVGLLLAATLLLPNDKGMLGKTALGYVRAASWAALAWAGAAFLTMVFSVSDVWARPVPEILDRSFLVGYASQESPGHRAHPRLLFGVAIALFSRGAITAGASGALLVFALAALLPPALTGHSASSPNHGLATTGLALHLLTLALWVGGLAVLALHALLKKPQLDVAADRFSRMALWCLRRGRRVRAGSVVARLADVSDLWTSSYGVLIVIKIVAFVLLGYVGWWHRQRTLVELTAGRPRAFARLAGGELLFMLATVGLAVALARTPPPPVSLPAGRAFDLLGYPVPPPISLANIASLWWFDLFFAIVAAVLAGLYGAGVIRLARRGDSLAQGPHRVLVHRRADPGHRHPERRWPATPRSCSTCT